MKLYNRVRVYLWMMCFHIKFKLVEFRANLLIKRLKREYEWFLKNRIAIAYHKSLE